MNSESATPCVGVCSTIYGDDICRGCHRHSDEVIQWNSMNEKQKKNINFRLAELQEKFTSQYIEVVNINALLSSLKQYHIRFNPSAPPLAWAYKLLKSPFFQKNFMHNNNPDPSSANLNLININLANKYGIKLKLENLTNLKFLNLTQISTKISTTIDEEIFNFSQQSA